MAESAAKEGDSAARLLGEMVSGNITEISPRLDPGSGAGFSYPVVEEKLGLKGTDALALLESLAERGILNKTFFDKFLRCPQCQSLNLRPTLHCPKCGSGNINRGRILEHLVCKYLGLEDEFIAGGRLICPKCRMELQTMDVDYRSRGLMRKCYNCGELFTFSVIKWRCLQCSSIISEDRVTEVNVYSYSLNEAKRGWLEFELKPKTELIASLKRRGYDVVESAIVRGRSGAEHTLDILASRDDGIATHRLAVGIKTTTQQIPLKEIFEFDDKAYDIGIPDKVLIILSELDEEATAFAQHQRINVVKVADLGALIMRAAEQTTPPTPHPFKFQSQPQLVDYLRERGYQVTEKAVVKGRSGADHTFDILASRNDGIVTHEMAIGIEAGEAPVDLGKVFDFDDKAYDAGIHDKVFIASPRLSREAALFAARQRIRVYETGVVKSPDQSL
jgi:uncharacterized protein YebE (UPF0316 family)